MTDGSAHLYHVRLGSTSGERSLELVKRVTVRDDFRRHDVTGLNELELGENENELYVNRF